MVKEFLDYGGLSIYHELITKLITENEIELKDLKLTDDYKLEFDFTKGGKPKSLTINLSSFVTEWEELK